MSKYKGKEIAWWTAFCTERKLSPADQAWCFHMPDNRASAHGTHTTATEHDGAKRRKIETRSTATEHAARSNASSSAQRTHTKHGTATEHAPRSNASSSARKQTLECNAETKRYRKDAKADRANNDTVLLKINLIDFLQRQMRDWNRGWDCIDIVERALKSKSAELYGEDELKLHKKLWDIMTWQKDGKAKKDGEFVAWCRRIADAATEHFHGTGISAYDNLARAIFETELTPAQKNDQHRINKPDRFGKTMP